MDSIGRARVALVDWDGTMRRGFTMQSWATFLASNGVFKPAQHDTIDIVFKQLFHGAISHDQAARLSARAYAKALRGASEDTIGALAREYVGKDRCYLFAYVPKFFDLLRTLTISPIVISGAPSEVLSQYQLEYHLFEIHALRLKTASHIYTGDVDINPGISDVKRMVVRTAVQRQNVDIVVALGDSASDLPLLEVARAGVMLGNAHLSHMPHVLRIDPDTDDPSEALRHLL